MSGEAINSSAFAGAKNISFEMSQSLLERSNVCQPFALCH
jgi:hypothetical protein